MENDGFFILDRWGYIQVGVREGCWARGRGAASAKRGHNVSKDENLYFFPLLSLSPTPSFFPHQSV